MGIEPYDDSRLDAVVRLSLRACGPPFFKSIEQAMASDIFREQHPDERMGEIYMIAVDPDFQRRGIATDLISHSLAWLREAGMTTVTLETGGDPGHAPARQTYEAVGFRLYPMARYFMKL